MTTTFFEFSTSTITAMLGYAGSLISNAMPLIVVVLGIGLALWIIDHFLLKR